jgi:hypothetical protein
VGELGVKIAYLFYFTYLIFCSAEHWIVVLAHAKQVLSRWAAPPAQDTVFCWWRLPIIESESQWCRRVGTIARLKWGTVRKESRVLCTDAGRLVHLTQELGGGSPMASINKIRSKVISRELRWNTHEEEGKHGK